MNKLPGGNAEKFVYQASCQETPLLERLCQSVKPAAPVQASTEPVRSDAQEAGAEIEMVINEVSPTSEAPAGSADGKPRHKTFALPDPQSLNVEVGRNIGYDYAFAGLRPPPDAPQAIKEGYLTGRHKKLHKPHDVDMFERKWLRLRYSAWRRNRLFDENVTPDYLKSLYRETCPITRVTMTNGTGTDSDASVERVYNDSAYAVGNLMFMSAGANKAKANRPLEELVEIAVSGKDFEGLPNISWHRLACLANLMQPESGRMLLMPLNLCPPARLVISNPAALLQDTLSMVACGRAPQKLLIAFRQLSSGKVCKRALDETVDILQGAIMRGTQKHGVKNVEWAIEDAWCHPALFARFSSWFVSLSISQVNAMLDLNMKLRHKSLERATDQALNSWAIDTRGYDRPRNQAA